MKVGDEGRTKDGNYNNTQTCPDLQDRKVTKLRQTKPKTALSQLIHGELVGSCGKNNKVGAVERRLGDAMQFLLHNWNLSCPFPTSLDIVFRIRGPMHPVIQAQRPKSKDSPTCVDIQDFASELSASVSAGGSDPAASSNSPGRQFCCRHYPRDGWTGRHLAVSICSLFGSKRTQHLFFAGRPQFLLIMNIGHGKALSNLEVGDEEFQLPEKCQVGTQNSREHDLYSFSISELKPNKTVIVLVAKASLDDIHQMAQMDGHVNF
ncbi:hypothetical protein Tco_0193657 [Tanacetum coccineum]